MPSDQQVLGFERKTAESRVLCAFNFSDQGASLNTLKGLGTVLRRNGYSDAELKPSGWAIIELD